MTAADVWLSVPGWPWHEANPHTMQVRSIDHRFTDRLGRRRFRPGKILAPIPQANGGLDRVNLCHGSRRRAITIARIVEAAVAAGQRSA